MESKRGSVAIETGRSASPHHVEHIAVECGVLTIAIDLLLKGLDHGLFLHILGVPFSQGDKARFERMVVGLPPRRFR